MPEEVLWRTWPLMSIRESYEAYMDAEGAYQLSLTNYTTLRDPACLSGRSGLCVGLCNRWLHRFMTKPWEAPRERITALETDFGAAAASHLFYRELLGQSQGSLGRSRDEIAQLLSSVARGSRLTFQFVSSFMPDDQSMAEFAAKLHNCTFNLCRINIHNGGSHSIAFRFVLGGSSQFFDPNLGEFSIGFEAFEQFLTDYHDGHIAISCKFEQIDIYQVEHKMPDLLLH